MSTHSSSATSPTGLAILPAEQADIDRIMEIQFSAFENDACQQALYPGDQYSPDVRKAGGARMLRDWVASPEKRFMKCVSTETGAILGFASWKFYEKPRSEEDWAKAPVVDFAEGRLKERAFAFMGGLAAMRRKVWEGRPHVMLSLLCVHPDSQGQGVGKALVRWGLEQSRRLDLPAYLEASVAGFPVYKKLGFEQIDTVVVKAEDYDGECDQNMVVMVKYPEPTY